MYLFHCYSVCIILRKKIDYTTIFVGIKIGVLTKTAHSWFWRNIFILFYLNCRVLKTHSAFCVRMNPNHLEVYNGIHQLFKIQIQTHMFKNYKRNIFLQKELQNTNNIVLGEDCEKR